MSGYRCTYCGNTKKFYREVLGTVSFKTKKEMKNEKTPAKFLHWASEVICEECYEYSGVEEV